MEDKEFRLKSHTKWKVSVSRMEELGLSRGFSETMDLQSGMFLQSVSIVQFARRGW